MIILDESLPDWWSHWVKQRDFADWWFLRTNSSVNTPMFESALKRFLRGELIIVKTRLPGGF